MNQIYSIDFLEQKVRLTFEVRGLEDYTIILRNKSTKESQDLNNLSDLCIWLMGDSPEAFISDRLGIYRLEKINLRIGSLAVLIEDDKIDVLSKVLIQMMGFIE